jgi:glutathione S-transferase
MGVRLYALPSSHPCAVVEAALRLKGIEYRRIDVLPLTQLVIGPIRYGGTTVPGLRIDRERLHGSLAILRRLDELVPEPPLLPADAGPVLEAERWGHDVLQAIPRRIVDAIFLRRPETMLNYVGDAKLPLPTALLKPALPLTARLMARKNDATDELVRGDLAALPGHLDRIDGWVATGLLGGESPNAADLQIGSSIQLLLSYGDVAPLLEARPCAALARYFRPLPGSIPAGVLPGDWIA